MNLENFLCNRHRQQLVNQPQLAIHTWEKLITAARFSADKRLWSKASIIYGHALEVASLIILSRPNKGEAKRYIRTAIEFAYVLRQNRPDTDLQLLIAIVKDYIAENTVEIRVDALLSPLIEMAFSPMVELRRWINLLRAEEESQLQAIHWYLTHRFIYQSSLIPTTIIKTLPAIGKQGKTRIELLSLLRIILINCISSGLIWQTYH